MIELRNISFQYDSRPVLEDLNLSLGVGDRIGLAGPNGSGKTTVCRIIMGLTKPDSGRVEIFGRERASEADFADVRGRVGYLFQDSDDQLFCPTVLDDVAFGPLNLGKSEDEAKEVVATTLASLGLSGFEPRYTHQLSGGEKRLVSLAAVLAMQPEVLILDEPTSGLDEDTVERLAEILKNSELTYLIVSHDAEFLRDTTDRILEMKRGRIRDAAHILT